MTEILTDQTFLRSNSEPVSLEEGLELAKTLIDVANSTPHAFGLSAIQIGIKKRVGIVFNHLNPHTRKPEWDILINPKIYAASGKIISYEGCLSIPNKQYLTERAQRVQVYSEAWEDKIRWFRDIWAIGVQQEIDHMNGLLITDRIHIPTNLSRNDKVKITNHIDSKEIKFKDLHKYPGWIISNEEESIQA